ncbi:MAG: glycosyltransferase, partial [Candidatus Thorarchaeota archaeon]
LRNALPSIRLVIAGRGTEESSLRRLVARFDLGKNVQFFGWVDYEHSFAFQAVADMLIAPRRPLQNRGIDISTPMKIPSYLTASRPIIASRVGEIPYMARHMKEAFLVPHSDPGSLAQAVLTIWNDPTLSRHLSAGARARAEQYSWKLIASELSDLYERILTVS